MKPSLKRLLLLVFGAVALCAARVAAQTNSWVAGGGKWEDGGNWSAGTPATTQIGLWITNAGTKEVAIDAVTPASTLTVSNLTLAGSNTLALAGSGTNMPLTILKALRINAGSGVTLSNAALGVPGSILNTFDIDGQFTLREDAVVLATNWNAGVRIGTVAGQSGMLTMLGGLWQGTNSALNVGVGGAGHVHLGGGTLRLTHLNLGTATGGNGVFVLSNGTLAVQSQFNIAADSAATGSVWISGGQLLMPVTMRVASDGIGQMTVSNGLVRVGGIAVSQSRAGTLTIAGGTVEVTGTVPVGNFVNSTGTVWLIGGQLTMTNHDLYVGYSGAGTLVVSNDAQLAARVTRVGHFAGSSGTFTVAGGQSRLYSLLVGASAGSTGLVQLTAGQVTVTNLGPVIGQSGHGALSMSGGTNLFRGMTVGLNGTGTVSVAGGVLNLSDLLVVGSGATGVGSFWLTGGQVNATTSLVVIGSAGSGVLTISTGTLRGQSLYIAISAPGSLNVLGGTLSLTSNLVVGATNTVTGKVTVSGGELIATNATSYLGYAGNAELVISNGVAGFATLVAGNCASNVTGQIRVTGGTVTITSLDLLSGTYEQTGGAVTIDRLVVTNSCGVFRWTGGSLTLGALQLDPNLDADNDGLPNVWEQASGLDPLSPAGVDGAEGDPDGDGLTNLQEQQAGTNPRHAASGLAVAGAQTEGTDFRITWRAVGGRSYIVQTNSTPAGSGFTDLTVPIQIPGSGETTTNYLHVGGATNAPVRFYRVRLVP